MNNQFFNTLLAATTNAGVPIYGSTGVWYITLPASTTISSGMKMTGITVNTNQAQNVYSKGKAVNTTVGVLGAVNCFSGGSVISCTVSSRGGLSAYSSSIIIAPYVTSVGNCYILAGGTAINVSTTDWANLYVRGGLILGGSLGGGWAYVSSGGVVANISANATVNVSDGGRTSDIQIGSQGKLIVFSGGTTVHPTLASAGSLTISSGGSALSVVADPATVVVLQDGGYLDYQDPVWGLAGVWLTSGGTASANAYSSTFNMSGVTVGSNQYQLVYYQGIASSCTYSRASAYASKQGQIIDPVVSNGLISAAAGGVIVNAHVINNNGYYYIGGAGTGYNFNMDGGGYGYIYTGGYLSGAIVNGGSLRVYINASADNIIMSNGSLGIYNNGTINDVIVRGGVVEAYNTATLMNVEASAGSIKVYNQGVLSNITISAGDVTLSSGGTGTTMTIMSAGTMTISSGGTALAVTTSSGATITVLDGSVFERAGSPPYKRQLAYLESDWGQVIDTGIVPTTEQPTVRMTFMCTSSGDYDICGFDDQGALRYHADYMTAGNYIRMRYGPTAGNTFNLGTVYVNEVYDMALGPTSIVNDDSYTFGSQDFSTNTKSILLFKGRTYASMRIYKATVLLDNVVVRDYIPVLDFNDVPCMYDKISDELFYNVGSYEFLYGELT